MRRRLLVSTPVWTHGKFSPTDTKIQQTKTNMSNYKNEPAEKQVYNILKRLDPARYDVFYDRRVVGMRPGERKEDQTDFLVADLGGGRFNGLLVLEVKGGIVTLRTVRNNLYCDVQSSI